jgi:hypothetical protein
MPAHLLAISHWKEDIQFCELLASLGGYKFHQAVTRNDVRRVLTSGKDEVLVFWNAESTTLYEHIGEVIPRYAKPRKVFAITDEPLAEYDHLFKAPTWGHHIVRRYQKPAAAVYSKLCAAALAGDGFGVARYFPPDTPVKTLSISRSKHKGAVIDALQNSLTKQGIKGRLAASVAQAADELMLNAIFDAPVYASGNRVRWELPRDTDFEMLRHESVEVDLVSTEDYMAVCVRDHYGSLKKKTIVESLRKGMESDGPRGSAASAGLGLAGILNAGMSLLFAGQPKKSVEMSLFFPKAESYREFRGGIRFLSLNGD